MNPEAGKERDMAKGEGAGAPPEAVGGAKERKEKPRAGDPFQDIRFEDLKPYTTADELPEDRVEYHSGKTDEGGTTQRRTVYCGAPRFYLEHTRTNPAGIKVYNLVGKYRNGKGVGSRNARVLKVMPRNKATTGMSPRLAQDRKRDAEIFELLTKVRGIPVYQPGEAP